jgi:pantothenate kinase
MPYKTCAPQWPNWLLHRARSGSGARQNTLAILGEEAAGTTQIRSANSRRTYADPVPEEKQVPLPALARYLLVRSAETTADGRRLLVGIAGPPAAGKSTLAERLRDEVNRRAGRATAEVAPMDGFHLPNATLDTAGSRARKGAPDTFDAAGYADLLARLRESQEPVAWPTFDRRLDAPVPAGATFLSETTIAITEGNYLLVSDGPWAAVRGLLDVAWYVDAEVDALRPRLLRRHVRGGRSSDEAAVKTDTSDLANAVLISATRHRADLVLRADSEGPRPASYKTRVPAHDPYDVAGRGHTERQPGLSKGMTSAGPT